MGLSTKLPAGKLRHLVQVLSPSNSQDSTGGVSTDNFAVLRTVYAAIEPVTTRDQLAVGEFVSTTTHRITLRYFPGLKSNMQIKFGKRKFQILGLMNPNETTKMLYVMVVEINDGTQGCS